MARLLSSTSVGNSKILGSTLSVVIGILSNFAIKSKINAEANGAKSKIDNSDNGIESLI